MAYTQKVSVRISADNKQVLLTELEAFVYVNRGRKWEVLASETNRTFETIHRAYNRAMEKVANQCHGKQEKIKSVPVK